ncbi:hypothetical protein C7M84_002027 [Penaeus vannamei]|uniref:Transmembrane protein n=1 Tax=Penaeus vannamei TaxID=6689 RepID=A0A3R7SWZ7_PENVA|nr:hypothetical protein C7M84_002027 [Penaeus vannamei]
MRVVGHHSEALEDIPSTDSGEIILLSLPQANNTIPSESDVSAPNEMEDGVESTGSLLNEENEEQKSTWNSERSGATDFSNQDISQIDDTVLNQAEPVTNHLQEVAADHSEVKEMECYSSSDVIQQNEEEAEAFTAKKPLQLRNDELSFGETESESVVDLSLISGSDSLSSSIKPQKIKKRSKKMKSIKVVRDGKDSDSSVSSKKKGYSRKILVKCKFAPEGLKYIEDCLRGHIFSGWVDERKWIENLGSYRDIVEVDEWETDLSKQLNIIIRKIPGVQEGTKWINITPPSAAHPSYCLWVLLEEAPIPGHYWFVITSVGVQSLFGLKISLRIIRSIHPQDYEEAETRSIRRKQLASDDPGKEMQAISQQFADWWDQAQNLNFALVWSAIATTFTLSNIRDAIRFLIILIVTLTVGLMTFLRESHHVVLRFIHEAGIFLHNVTPFLQSVMSFVEKILGGLYLLLAMVYRDWRRSCASPPPSFQGPRQTPLPIMPDSAPPPSYPPAGPRVVKYVAPEQWVYKRQDNVQPPNVKK